MEKKYKISYDTIADMENYITIFCKKLFPNVDNRPMIELMVSRSIYIAEQKGFSGLSSYQYESSKKQIIFEAFVQICNNQPIYLDAMFEAKDKNVFNN